MDSPRRYGLALLPGLVAGAGSWLIAYATIYVLVSEDVRDSPIHQFIDVVEGEPATYELVGWVFYNAHFVTVVLSDVPLVGSRTISTVGGEDGFTPVLYLIPAALLVLAGLALAFVHEQHDPVTGALAGVRALPAYLVLSVVGVFAFEVTIGSARGAPDLLAAVFLAGIVYPVFFGGIGGAIGGWLHDRVGPRGKRSDRRV